MILQIESETTTKDAEKATVEPENAKALALKHKLEEQKVIEHSKLVAEKAHQEGIHTGKKLKKLNLLLLKWLERLRLSFFYVKYVYLKEAELASHKIVRANEIAERVKKSTQNPELTEDLNIFLRNFLIKHYMKSTYPPVQYVKPPHCQPCHIRYYHEEYCCDNCCEYFTNLVNMKDHTQLII